MRGLVPVVTGNGGTVRRRRQARRSKPPDAVSRSDGEEQDREFVDLDRAGIIDPARVVRTALENAVSVAGVILLAQTTMVEIEEREPTPVAEPDFR